MLYGMNLTLKIVNLKYNEGLTYIIDYFLTVKVVQNGGGGCYQQCKGSLSG